MQEFMSPEKLIEMFAYEITSTQPIGKISEKVPATCEIYKFALLQTYYL